MSDRFLTCVAAFALALGTTVSASAQATETPTVVPRGERVFEADLVALSRDRAGGVRTRTLVAGSFLLSTGVAHGWDLQFGADAFVREAVRENGTTATARGLGDAVVRAKWNCCGDEHEGLAFALLPFVKLPTAGRAVGNGKVEGGLIVPLGMPLGDGHVHVAAGWERLAVDGAGRAHGWSLAAAVSHPLTERLDGYIETLASEVAGGGERSAVEGGIGLVWSATDRLALDLAVYAGVTRAAPDRGAVLRCVYSF